MTNLDKEDRAYFQQEFKDTRDEVAAVHERLDPVCQQVATNTTDIGWLKRSHWTFVGIAGTVLGGIVLFLVVG